MSYLHLAKGPPDFSKAVFSLWFRVPKESAKAAYWNSIPVGAGFYSMTSVLPLVTFGKLEESKNYQTVYSDVAVYHYTPVPPDGGPLMAPHAEEGEPFDVDPSHIGLLCREDGSFNMVFHIQTNVFATWKSLVWVLKQMDWYASGPSDQHPGDGWFSGHGKSTIEDISYIISDEQPEAFHVVTNLVLQPDKWHHLLLSFDISGTVSLGSPYATSDCKMWYAIDDVDYRGAENLQPYRDASGPGYSGDGLGDNVIVTRVAKERSKDYSSYPILFYNNYVPAPYGHYNGAPLATSSGELGIPASTKWVNTIFRVEMSEFQMCTGVTLDTKATDNRRAFVDADGKPVNPTKPANPNDPDDKRTPAEKLLGKKPEILLHGSSDWIKGYNTGTTGIKIEIIDGKETITKLPAGQFDPIAVIRKYKPDPSLETAT